MKQVKGNVLDDSNKPTEQTFLYLGVMFHAADPEAFMPGVSELDVSATHLTRQLKVTLL